MIKKRIFRSLVIGCLVACTSSLYAQVTEPVIIFGDSLSDNGNVTHLLQTLRKEKQASYIEEPFRNFLQRTLAEQAEKLHLSKQVTAWGQSIIAIAADKIVAPAVVEVLSRVQKVPLLPLYPYWHYHFSNGKVWNEYLAESMGISIADPLTYENHAFGGSWAVTDDKQLSFWELVKHPEATLTGMVEGKLVPPSLGLVIDSYLLDKGKANSKASYFLLSGGNDYLNMLDFKKNKNEANIEKYARNVVHGILYSANRLLHNGATKMVVFGVPDVASTPHFNQHPNRHLLSYGVTFHNRLLEEGVNELQHQYPASKITFINMQTLLQELIDTADQYDINNTQNACIDAPLPRLKKEEIVFHNNIVLENALIRSEQPYSQCDQPSQYVFWDEIHPTTKAHKILAERVCLLLNASGFTNNCKSS